MSDASIIESLLEKHSLHELKDYLSETLGESEGVERLRRATKQLKTMGVRALALQLARMNQVKAAMACWLSLKDSGRDTVVDRFALASMGMQFRGLAIHPDHYRPVLEEFTELARVAPKLSSVWINIAGYWLNSLEPVSVWGGQAQRAATNALSTGANPVETRYLLGVIKESRGRCGEAADDYRRVLSMEPGHAAARVRLAWLAEQSLVVGRDMSFLDHNGPAIPSSESLQVSKAEGMTQAVKIFNTYGAVIVRDLIPAADLEVLLDKYRHAVVERQKAEGVGMWPVQDVDSKIRADLEKLLDSTDVASWLEKICSYRFPAWEIQPRHDWHIQWRGPDPHEPTRIHQDCPVYINNSEFITCWFTCSNCGNGDAPGLELYLDNVSHPLHFVEQFPDAPAAVSRDFLTEYLADRSWSPRMSPGDVLLFRPNLFHRTECDRSWDSYRMSYDLRFQCGPSAPGFSEIVE